MTGSGPLTPARPSPPLTTRPGDVSPHKHQTAGAPSPPADRVPPPRLTSPARFEGGTVMFKHLRPAARGPRHGTAAVELAVLLPFLAFMFVIGLDFARVFYFSITLTNCARNGAYYGSQDATHATDT